MKLRSKIIHSVCITTAASAIAIAFVLSSLSPTHVDPVDKKDFKVSFSAGEGQFESSLDQTTEVYAGTHFDQVDQPAVFCPGKMFAGWTDASTGKPIMGRQTVNRNMNLVASYRDYTGEYCTITFSAGKTGCSLRGNVSIAVNNGYFFFMVNRPSAKLTNSVFTGWKYASGSKAGELVSENDSFDQDVTLEPVFVKSLSLKWEGNGAEMVRGTATSIVEPNTKFRVINQPSFRKGTDVFEGWYKDEECTDPWLSDDEITEDTTAYANWVSTPTEYYCELNFVQKPGTSIVPIFSPAITQAVQKDKAWSNIFKPTVTTATADYRVEHWEYSEDGETWTTIQDDTEFNYDKVYVAPIFVPNVEEVYVYGDSQLTTQKHTLFNAYVLGCEDQSVTWKVYDSMPSQTGSLPAVSTNAYFNSEGVLFANFINKTSVDVYVQATSTLDTTKRSAGFKVKIVAPYVGSNKIWYTYNSCWYSLDMDELTDPSTTSYTATKLSDETTSTIPKAVQTTKFTNPIYIGDEITSLPDNFLIGWQNFNGFINFSEVTEYGKTLHVKNNVTKIGDSFLEGCINFNQYLDLSSIKSIGDNFLYDCNSFNNGNTGTSTITVLPINNANLSKIGNYFMGNCWSFNQILKLPTDEANGSLTSIGSFFMYNCLKYNKEIYLASTITSIDPYFMLNCASFNGSLILNCQTSVFNGNDQQICAIDSTFIDPSTSTSTDSLIYTQGLNVNGTYKYDFATKFPNKGDGTRHVYRTSKTGTEQHVLSASSEINSITAQFDKTTVDENQEFHLIVNNNRTEALTAGTSYKYELTVGSQHFITTLPDIPTGETTLTYTKTTINEWLVELGGSAMGISDSIDFKLIRVNCYTVSSNKISYVDENKTSTLLTDAEITALAGRFLYKNDYEEYLMSEEGTTFASFLASCKTSDANEVVLISGDYNVANSGQSITLKLHGAINPSNTKTARIIAYISSTSRISCSNISFKMDNLKVLGYTGEGAYNYYNFGIECPGLECLSCDFTGAYTLYTSDAKFDSCTFDSRGMYYLEGGAAKNIYPMFIYGNYSCATISNCTFYSGGKAIKIYADGSIRTDLSNTVSGCTFIYDSTYPEEVVTIPSVKSPIEVDSQNQTTYYYHLYVGSNTMQNYPTETTIPLYNIEGDHCVVHTI